MSFDKAETERQLKDIATQMTEALNSNDWERFASFFAPWYQSEWVYSQNRPLTREEMVSSISVYLTDPPKKVKDLDVLVVFENDGTKRADVMKNMEYSGFADGLARRTFSIFKFYFHEGNWLCVRTQGANGCDLIPMDLDAAQDG